MFKNFNLLRLATFFSLSMVYILLRGPLLLWFDFIALLVLFNGIMFLLPESIKNKYTNNKE
ncbi:MAG TPA: hypothetical protein VK177_16655 [Flavobacteriales bacterium]|nr:hypothetical protein [Flavobacteriales bacterium]